MVILNLSIFSQITGILPLDDSIKICSQCTTTPWFMWSDLVTYDNLFVYLYSVLIQYFKLKKSPSVKVKVSQHDSLVNMMNL